MKNSKSGFPILTTNDRLRNSHIKPLDITPFDITPLDITDYFPGLLNVDMICKGSILNLL